MILESKHCPPSNDVRALITHPLPKCQKEVLMRFFDASYIVDGPSCTCCYTCIRRHRDEGCPSCSLFMTTYFSSSCTKKIRKSAAAELKTAIEKLFEALGIDNLLVENNLEIPVPSFIKDFIYMCDEIHSELDIVDFWHIDLSIALKVYQKYLDFLVSNDYCERTDGESEASDEESDKQENEEDSSSGSESN